MRLVGVVGVFDFFFYGTLVDADVRRLVLGREVPDHVMRPALLSGFRRYAVRGQPYPAAVPVAGATVDGVLLTGASLRDAAMLSCFEGNDYDEQLCRVSQGGGGDAGCCDAWVFVASDRVPHDESGWSIDEWRAQHKPAFVEIAKAWLGGIGAADIAAAETVWRERSLARNGR